MKNFENVSVHEIIDVEQGMINDGTDVEELNFDLKEKYLNKKFGL